MSGIEHALHDALSWLRPAWDVIARLAATLWHRVVLLWCEVRDRHERLMDTDPRYPVALASGGAAAVKVFVANPAVAKALSGLIVDLLGVPDTSPRPISSPAWRPTPAWPPRPSTALWDREEWDEDE